MENRERNSYFDRIRVAAMFLVIGVHAVGSIEQYAGNGIERIFVDVLGRLNSLGVSIFLL